MRRARDLGLTIPVVASVAVYTDAVSAHALQGLPGLDIDEQQILQVLDSSDREEAGIAAAVEEARRLLDTHEVAGVNISGLASDRSLRRAAEIKAEVGHRVRALA